LFFCPANRVWGQSNAFGNNNLSKRMVEKEFKGWADEYESAALERRRVILSQLFSRIEIGRGYEVKVEIAMSYNNF